MREYAQIIGNKVHGVFKYNVLPQFDNTIVMIDVTDLDTLPNTGDDYDGTNFATPTPQTLSENKQSKIKQLQDKFQASFNTYLAQYPKAEIDSFNDKKNEALAYNLDNNAPTPIIDSIILGSGTTKADYIASVLAKVNALATKEGEMVKIRDAIKACTTQAELDAIVI